MAHNMQDNVSDDTHYINLLKNWCLMRILSATGAHLGHTKEDYTTVYSWDGDDADDNIWGVSTTVDIFKWSKGWGLREKIPSGWSSWTYEPDILQFLMVCDDWATFYKMGLTDSMRERLPFTETEGPQ